MKRVKLILVVLPLVSCIEKFEVEGQGGGIIEGGKGVWVLTTLSPEVWYIKDSAQRIFYADLWANDILKVYDTLFVVNSGSNTIFKFSLGNKYADTIDVGEGRNPYNIAYSWVKGEIFISNFLTGTISVFKGKNLVREFKTCANPEGIITTGKHLYVACTNFSSDYHGEVRIYDIFSFEPTDTLIFGVNTQTLINDPEGDIYVLSTGNYSDVESWLFRVHGGDVDSFYIGGYMGNMCISEKGYIFITGWYGGVYKFDWVREKGEGTIIKNISASSCAVKGDTLIVADFDNNRILFSDFRGNIIKTFYVGDGPIDIYAE